MPRKIRFVAAVAALVVIAGCGGGGGTTVKTGNGEVKTGDKGNVEISTKEDSLSIGAGTDLPDEFPKDVPTPDDLQIQAAATNTQDGKQDFVITYTAPDAKKAYEDYKSKLTGDGFTVTNDDTTEADGKFRGGLEATKGTWKVNVVAGVGDEGMLTVGVHATG